MTSTLAYCRRRSVYNWRLHTVAPYQNKASNLHHRVLVLALTELDWRNSGDQPTRLCRADHFDKLLLFDPLNTRPAFSADTGVKTSANVQTRIPAKKHGCIRAAEASQTSHTPPALFLQGGTYFKNKHINGYWSGLVRRSHPLGARAQEAEERRVEVEVLGVELLQLLHSDVDDLRTPGQSKRRRPCVKILILPPLYLLCTGVEKLVYAHPNECTCKLGTRYIEVFVF